MNEIPDPVREAARERPDAPALITPDETVSYADLDRRVAAAVVGLRAHGLTRGDRLAIYLPTSVEYLVLLLAAFRMGVVACPLSTRLPAAAAPGLLDRIACRTLVAEPGASWDELRVIPPPLPGKATGSGGVEGSVWRLDAPATIFFTSGSTGTPKAALHTLGNHVFSAQGAGSFFDLRAGDRWMLNLPLFHVGGLGVLFRCVLSGAAIVLPSPGAPVEAVVAEHGVTHASMVATQLLRVLRGPDAEALRRLKVLLLGGSAIPPGLLDEAHARGLPVHTSYGMTEMASTVTVPLPTSPWTSRFIG